MLPNERTSRSEIVAAAQRDGGAGGGRRSGRCPAAGGLPEGREAEHRRWSSDAEAAFEEALLHRPNLLVIHEDLASRRRHRALPATQEQHPHPLPARHRRAPGRQAPPPHPARWPPAPTRFFRRAWTSWRNAPACGPCCARRPSTAARSASSDVQRSALKERGRWVGTFVHDLQNVTGALQANFEFLAQAAAAAASDSSDDVLECARETRQVFQQLTRGLRTRAGLRTLRVRSGDHQSRSAIRLDELLAEVKEERALARRQRIARPGRCWRWSRPSGTVGGGRSRAAPAGVLRRWPPTSCDSRAPPACCCARPRSDDRRCGSACRVTARPIPREDRERIFEPYVAADPTAAPGAGPGSGAGAGGHRAARRDASWPTSATRAEPLFVVELKSRGAKPNLHLDE